MSTVKGDLGSIGVPEIFRAIASEDRTGRLVLRRGATEAHVFFRDGDAYHARMLSNRVRLGERLVSAGMLSHEELAESLEMQSNDPRGLRLGQLLIERGLVDTDGLAAIVRQQIEDTIFELLRWDGGTFEFEPEIASDEDIGLQVSVENLVMEGARRFREWHQITRKLPSMDAVPRLNDDDDAGIEVALTPEEWALISRVNGRATVVELANACGFTELEAARCVFGLLTTGVLKITLPEGVEVPPEDPALEEMFDELERALQESARDRSSEGVSHPTLEELVGAPAPLPAAIEEASSELPGFDALPLIRDEERFARPEETDEILIEDDHPVDDLVIAAEDEEHAPVDLIDQPPEVQLEILDQQDETASGVTSAQEEAKAWYDEPYDASQTAAFVPIDDGPATEDDVADPPAWYDQPVEVEASVAVPDLEVLPDTDLAVIRPEEEEADDLSPPAPEPQLRPSAADWGDLQPAVPAPEPSLTDEQSATVLVEEQVRPMRGINGYARMFSELSMSDDLAESPQPAEEPEKEQPEPETRPEPINATKRPVDPSVDTTALLREFSGLTDEVSEDAVGMGTFEPITRTPASIADEKRGLFGKKKR